MFSYAEFPRALGRLVTRMPPSLNNLRLLCQSFNANFFLSFITWLFFFSRKLKFLRVIGMRTSCRPIRSPAAPSSDFVTTRMITDRIGLHSVLLPLQINCQSCYFLPSLSFSSVFALLFCCFFFSFVSFLKTCPAPLYFHHSSHLLRSYLLHLLWHPFRHLQ